MTESATNLKRDAGSAWHVNADQIATDLGFVSGSGSPSGTVTPAYIGQEYFDTSGATWYKATTLLSSGWVSGGNINLGALPTITFADAGNIAAGTTTGTKIGTATTQKFGFYNATPVVQPTSASEAAVTTATITTAATSTTPFGYATSTQANAIATQVAANSVLVNQLRADLVALGLIKGS